VWILLSIGIVLRVVAIGGLFLTADRNAGPFTVFFGDEQFFLERGMRLYNIWMDRPISVESFLYAFDKTGYTSYQGVLVFLQILFGPVPYAIHMFNVLVFLSKIFICGCRVMREDQPEKILGDIQTLMSGFAERRKTKRTVP